MDQLRAALTTHWNQQKAAITWLDFIQLYENQNEKKYIYILCNYHDQVVEKEY